MKDYSIYTFYSKADRGYIVDIPDLDACSAFGETPGEALLASGSRETSLAGGTC